MEVVGESSRNFFDPPDPYYFLSGVEAIPQNPLRPTAMIFLDFFC